MKPTQTLTAEHRVIEKTLDALEHSLQNWKKGDAPPTSLWEKALDFLKEYADRLHHGKEEVRLFPRMNQRGMPLDSGPLACMLHDHDRGRGLLKTVRESLEPAIKGDPTAAETAANAYREYIVFLREHIKKEDEILFNMADQIMTPEDQEELEKSFKSFEKAEFNSEFKKNYEKIAEDLLAACSAGT